MNRLLTMQEATRMMLDDVKAFAKQKDIPEMAVAIFLGLMLGAPIAEESVKWAADEIGKAIP